MNRTIGESITDLLSALAAVKDLPLAIMEIGCQRDNDEAHRIGDGHSTTAVARWVLDGDGLDTFVSIDSEAEHINAARAALRNEGLETCVRLIHARGEQAFGGMKIDFLYLDGSNDASETMAQLQEALPWLRAPALVLIDDVYAEAAVNKGAIAVPFTRSIGKKDFIFLNRLGLISFGADGIVEDLLKNADPNYLRPADV